MGIIRFFTNRMLKRREKRDEETFAQQVLPEGIEEKSDIAYIDDGNKGHLLDIYFPKNAAAPLLVILNIHGGGFLMGDKRTDKLYCYRLAKQGNVVFNINYRLAMNDAKVPGQIQDVVMALSWIDTHLNDYSADRKRIYVSSDSAGCVLAVMAALIIKNKRLQEIYKAPAVLIDIKALALISGLMSFDRNSIAYWGMRSFCFDKGYKKQDTYQNMRFADLDEIKKLPPVFLATSAEDELQDMTLDFEKILKQNGVPYKLKNYEKKPGKKLGHMFCVLFPDYEESEALIKEILDFYETVG